MRTRPRTILHKLSSTSVCALYLAATAQTAAPYAFNQIVPDVRQPVTVSGGSACPVRAHQLSAPSSIAVRWSTTLGASPVSVLTQDQTATGRLTAPCCPPASRRWPAPQPKTPAAPTASTPSASIKPTQPSRPASSPSPASSLPTRSANKSAAAPPPRSSARFSTPTFISIPATRKSPSPRPPLCPPLPNPTTSPPSSPTNSAIFSASATPPCGAP